MSPRRRRKPKYVPKTRYPAEYLRRDEVLALLEACGHSATGIRNRALIVVMWRAGLRLGEALALRTLDVDIPGKAVRVRHGKGDKSRTVAMDARAFDELAAWLATRMAVVPSPADSPIFCTLQGAPMAQSYVRKMLPRLAARAGVSRRVHAHEFRHTFAVELVREGKPVEYIRQLLGHTNLATTSIYLAGLSPEEALNAVRDREW